MLFSSIPFLYYFLPCVLLIYFLVPGKMKNFILMISSLFFYAWGEPRYVVLMVVSIVVGYLGGFFISAASRQIVKKIILAVSVAVCIAFLGYYKYADFFIDNFNEITGMSVSMLKLTLPIGISFYTFQIVSYIVDVYRGEVKKQKNIINLAAYVTMFPQLIAGPIVRYSDIEEQLDNRNTDIDNIAYGIRRFVLGLGKKILIANTLGELCEIAKVSEDKSIVFFWIYAIANGLHIYFDFSGYSDMAIGLGKILGFHFPENFNYPFISKSITEFWRRWHMSLGTWFRDYVYIPLGGNRCGRYKWFRNIFIVWFLTGFWHGAAWNFIVWGLYFGALLIIEKQGLLKVLGKSKALSHVYVLLFVTVSFVIFNGSDMGDAFYSLRSMAGLEGYSLMSAETVYYLRSYGTMLIIAILGATPFAKNLALKIKSNTKGKKLIDILEIPFLIIVMVICTAYLVDGSFNPFLYFRF